MNFTSSSRLQTLPWTSLSLSYYKWNTLPNSLTFTTIHCPSNSPVSLPHVHRPESVYAPYSLASQSSLYSGCPYNYRMGKHFSDGTLIEIVLLWKQSFYCALNLWSLVPFCRNDDDDAVVNHVCHARRSGSGCQTTTTTRPSTIICSSESMTVLRACACESGSRISGRHCCYPVLSRTSVYARGISTRLYRDR